MLYLKNWESKMRELREDNNGFVQFPFMETGLKRANGKTLVYIVAFDEDEDYILSNNVLNLPGRYVTDDITGRKSELVDNVDEEEGDLVEILRGEKSSSFPLITSICIGWSNYSVIIDDEHWYATFRNLTNEGRKLYYSIKKLHNDKEVRILTLNEVK